VTAMHARALLAVPLAALLASDMSATGSATRPPDDAPTVWTEVEWPFRMDQWGRGRAFRCAAAHCGAELDLYLRAKVGFCNCTTGVADDDEIDRVGDTELIEGTKVALEPGHAVTVGFMHGRARPFRVDSRFAPTRAELAILLNNKCDAVVATVVGRQELERQDPGRQDLGREALTPAQEQAARAFLSGDKVQSWAKDATGLETQ
jgi:hypothetical protein